VSASDLFSDDLLQDVLVQPQVTHHAFQPGILFLKLARNRLTSLVPGSPYFFFQI
jgi:hypothetical protein